MLARFSCDGCVASVDPEVLHASVLLGVISWFDLMLINDLILWGWVLRARFVELLCEKILLG